MYNFFDVVIPLFIFWSFFFAIVLCWDVPTAAPDAARLLAEVTQQVIDAMATIAK